MDRTRRRTKVTFVFFMLGMAVVCAGPSKEARGQWSSDAAANLVVGDGAGDQVQPKIASTPDGGCYISWFDGGNGYDVRLQRLDRLGNEQWAHNGLLVCNRGVSSTVDYDLIIDAGGNAIVAYNDDSVPPGGGAQQISVSRIAPDGSIQWKATVTSDTNFKGNPQLVQLSDGGYVVGYSYSPTGAAQVWMMQKLDSNGAAQWTPPGFTVSEASHYLALSDMQGADTGFIALWVRGSSANPTTSTKALYIQKYDASGSAQWNGGSPVILFNTTSIQNGYFPVFLPDGAGGGVFGWYEIGGARNAYLHHVLADGTFEFASPVANTGATPGRIRTSASVAYDILNHTYFLASSETDDGGQANREVIVQKYDIDGNRMWGDNAVTVAAPEGMFGPSFIQVHSDRQGGAMLSWIWLDNTTQGYVNSARVGIDMSIAWSSPLSSTYASKARLASAWSACGFMMNAFTSAGDVQAQNVRPDGTLGSPPPLLGDLDCSGTVEFSDVGPFVLALLDPSGYALAHPCCNIEHADMNMDQGEDGLDVAGFVAAVLGP